MVSDSALGGFVAPIRKDCPECGGQGMLGSMAMRYLPMFLAVLVMLVVSNLVAEEAPQPGAGEKVEAGTNETGNPGEKGAVDAFGGPEVLAIVQQAEKVIAHRIEADAGTYLRTREYTVAGDGVVLSEKDARDLIATIMDPALYEWQDAKSCLPRPGIRFQFHRGGEVVDMPVCLECAIFMVDYKGKPVGGQNCDAAVTKLLDLAVRLFPKDASLAEMKRDRDAEAARREKLASLVSPTDGAKLVLISRVNDFDILESSSDGSIWLYEEGKGLHKPDPADQPLRETIDLIKRARP
jgi:hypothetical protein